MKGRRGMASSNIILLFFFVFLFLFSWERRGQGKSKIIQHQWKRGNKFIWTTQSNFSCEVCHVTSQNQQFNDPKMAGNFKFKKVTKEKRANTFDPRLEDVHIFRLTCSLVPGHVNWTKRISSMTLPLGRFQQKQSKKANGHQFTGIHCTSSGNNRRIMQIVNWIINRLTWPARPWVTFHNLRWSYVCKQGQFGGTESMKPAQFCSKSTANWSEFLIDNEGQC